MSYNETDRRIYELYRPDSVATNGVTYWRPHGGWPVISWSPAESLDDGLALLEAAGCGWAIRKTGDQPPKYECYFWQGAQKMNAPAVASTPALAVSLALIALAGNGHGSDSLCD